MKDEPEVLAPHAYRLSPQAARLLLAALGCRTLYGYLPQASAGREEGLACLAGLVRSRLVSNDGETLHIAGPLRAVLQTMADAPRVLHIRGSADACLYLARDSAALCLAPVGNGPMRLCALPAEGIWPALAQELPDLDLPDAAPGSVLPDSLPTLLPGPDGAELPGADVHLALLTPSGVPLRRAALCMHQGVPLMAVQAPGEEASFVLFTARQAEKWLEENP